MRKLFITYLILLPIFCLAQSNKNIHTKKEQQFIIERKVIDTIMHIEEVALMDILTRKNSNGKRHFNYAIWSRPSRETPYYWVKVREVKGFSFVTHYNFYVYPKDFSIKYLDPVSDTLISLKEFSKQIHK